MAKVIAALNSIGQVLAATFARDYQGSEYPYPQGFQEFDQQTITLVDLEIDQILAQEFINTYTPSNILSLEIRQKHHPVFLTDGTCDSNLPEKDAKELLDKLHLPYSDVDDFFPLTPQEQEYIGEDYAVGPHGGILMSNFVVYKGQKYFCPAVEICFFTGRFTRPSYGSEIGCLYAKAGDATNAANLLHSYIGYKIKPIGGHAIIHEYMEEDRHAVLLLIPTSIVLTFATYDLYKQWLTGMFKSYPTPRTGDITAENKEIVDHDR